MKGIDVGQLTPWAHVLLELQDPSGQGISELGQSKNFVPSGQSDAFALHVKSEHLTDVLAGQESSVAQFLILETQLLSGQRYFIEGLGQVAIYPFGLTHKDRLETHLPSQHFRGLAPEQVGNEGHKDLAETQAPFEHLIWSP